MPHTPQENGTVRGMTVPVLVQQGCLLPAGVPVAAGINPAGRAVVPADVRAGGAAATSPESLADSLGQHDLINVAAISQIAGADDPVIAAPAGQIACQPLALDQRAHAAGRSITGGGAALGAVQLRQADRLPSDLDGVAVAHMRHAAAEDPAVAADGRLIAQDRQIGKSAGQAIGQRRDTDRQPDARPIAGQQVPPASSHRPARRLGRGPNASRGGCYTPPAIHPQQQLLEIRYPSHAGMLVENCGGTRAAVPVVRGGI